MADLSGKHSYKIFIPRVMALLRGDWRDVGVVLVYAIGIGLASLAVPIAVNSLVNTVAFGTLLQPLVVLTSLVCGVLFISGIMKIMQLIVVEIMQRRLLVRLTLSMAQRLPHLQYYYFQRRYGSEYVLRFMEAFFAQKSVKILLLDGIAVSFQTIIGVILLAFYHPFFLIFSLVIFVVVILLITILWRPGVRTSYLESDAKYEVYEWLQDLAAYPLLFKSERGETLAVRKADNLTTGYIAARRNHFRIILTHYSAAVLLQTLGSAALLGLGGYLVAKQQLTLGQLVAAELILTVVLESVNKFGKQLEVCFDLAASIAKLDSLMNIPHEELSGTRFGFSQQPASLKLDRVAVRNWDGPLIIKNITCSLAPGEKIAIWGENGSGKSLLADCIFRLNTPHAGRIEIDNHPISDIHPLELRSEVVLVRGVEIFHGTVNENLTLGHESVSADEVRRSLLLVDLLDDILELPQGLNTYIKGHSILSSGQSNRLMIARALLERPRLFLIDGTLDQVDDQSRIKVLKSLLGEENPATLLVFTHDKEILCHFDRSYILQDGELVHG